MRLPIRQQGGKCWPCFWLHLVGGKVKTKQARRRKISFFNVLEQWEGLCYPDCPIDNPMYIYLLHISCTQRQTCAHTCNTKIPLASIGRTPSWADLHSRRSQLAPQVKFQPLPSWFSTICKDTGWVVGYLLSVIRVIICLRSVTEDMHMNSLVWSAWCPSCSHSLAA